MTTIIHFTTVHPRTDTRIRIKEAATLARELDADVCLYVQDGLGDEHDEVASIRIVDTGMRPGGRLARMTKGAWRMYRAVRRARPAIAHFHDPELISVGLLLKLSGIKVIYDVHEDLPRQIMAKNWIKPMFRKAFGVGATAIEWVAGKTFDGIILAAPVLEHRFPASKYTLVQNYPLPDELVSAASFHYKNRPPNFAYVGGITAIRSATEMVQALPLVEDSRVQLQLVGKFMPQPLQEAVVAEPGWSQVDFHGWLDRPSVARLLGQVRAGLVLFYPVPNHTRAQPNKLFEYMASGLPIIASDFPFWREILEGVDCALFVDPQDPKAIAEAMHWLLSYPDEAEAMGRRGQRAVQERFNWSTEGKKLVDTYRQLLR